MICNRFEEGKFFARHVSHHRRKEELEEKKKKAGIT